MAEDQPRLKPPVQKKSKTISVRLDELTATAFADAIIKEGKTTNKSNKLRHLIIEYIERQNNV